MVLPIFLQLLFGSLDMMIWCWNTFIFRKFVNGWWALLRMMSWYHVIGSQEPAQWLITLKVLKTMFWALLLLSHVIFDVFNSVVFDGSTQHSFLLHFLLALFICQFRLQPEVLLLKLMELYFQFFILLFNFNKSLQFFLFNFETFILC